METDTQQTTVYSSYKQQTDASNQTNIGFPHQKIETLSVDCIKNLSGKDDSCFIFIDCMTLNKIVDL